MSIFVLVLILMEFPPVVVIKSFCVFLQKKKKKTHLNVAFYKYNFKVHSVFFFF